MKFSLLFFIQFVYFSSGDDQICTDAFGYQPKFTTCWRPTQLSKSYADAEEECRSYNGATLVKVDSLLKNQGMQQYLGDMLYRETWIGLYCNGTHPTDCYWTHNRGILDFDVFGKWSPNATTGNCVVMNVKDGSWASRDCNQRTDSFCELPATTKDDCANNYDHHCYTLNQTSLSFADAQRTCQQSCGNLVSIHSELENRYVSSIISSENGTVSLGGVAPSSRTILWSDSSMQSYTNINQYDHGYCLFTNVSSSYDGYGYWFSDLCSKKSWFVCKRPTGIKC